MAGRIDSTEMTSFPVYKKGSREKDKQESDDKKESLKKHPEEGSDGGSLIANRVTIAGGFLDFALLTSNIEHLKYILEAGPNDLKYYHLLFWLVSVSLVLQLITGVLLFITGLTKKINQTPSEVWINTVLNHTTTGLVALIAIINFVLTSFGDRGEALNKFRNKCQGNQTVVPY